MTAQEYTLTDVKHDDVLDQIDRLLAVLGESAMDSVPYDTAWLARLSADYDRPIFHEALEWLRHNQHADGSWGGRVLYYHDRFICTLAAILALHLAGDGREDRQRIEMGERFLWENLGRLHIDAEDTVGFPVLVVALIREARQLGLDVPPHVTHNVAVIEKKLNLLGSDPRRWRYTTMSFSLEAVPPYLPDQSAFASTDFILDNGSVGASPAATAAYLLQTGHLNRASLGYLERVLAEQGDGGLPNITPVEVFETAWAMHQLWTVGALSPDHPRVAELLQMMWERWSPETGISCSEYFPVPDLDDTATAFLLLRWGGYPVSADVFNSYEADTHFLCYPGEASLSLSVNVRALAALQTERAHPQFEAWSQKLSAMVRHYDLNNLLWFDKWHISPYYLTSVAVLALQGVVDDVLPARIRWIMKTQHPDGGWGYYNGSTAEETALCIQALLHWDRHVERVDRDAVDAGIRFLLRNLDYAQYPRLWIGKCLYRPWNIMRATILAALYSYATH